VADERGCEPTAVARGIPARVQKYNTKGCSARLWQVFPECHGLRYYVPWSSAAKNHGQREDPAHGHQTALGIATKHGLHPTQTGD